MLSKPQIRLFKILAELYPDTASSTLLMDAAGIRLDRIFAEQGAGTRWYFVVREAEKAGQIPALLAVAMADYPEHADLLGIRAELGLSAAIAKRLPVPPVRVLAIWPNVLGQPPLDQEGEAEAMYAVGIDYVALRGEAATRDGLAREWARVKPDIVEVGAHGQAGLIYLTDGPAGPGWWGRLATEHQPQLMLLLACESSTSALFDIPDALLRAGVAAVIAVSDKIEDVDAVRFARVFYESLTALTGGTTMPLAQAVERAKLTLSDSGADMIRLRERTDA